MKLARFPETVIRILQMLQSLKDNVSVLRGDITDMKSDVERKRDIDKRYGQLDEEKHSTDKPLQSMNEKVTGEGASQQDQY